MGSVAGNTVITASPAVGSGYKIKIAASPTIPTYGQVCASGYANWNGVDEITAETGKMIVVVAVDKENKAVAVGTAAVVS